MSTSSKQEPLRLRLEQLTEMVEYRKLEPYKAEVPSAQWQDELTRFQNWAFTVRAQRTGLDSLDYRLRESLHITSWLEPALERMQNLLGHIEHVPENVAPSEGRVSFNSSVTVLQIVYNNLQDAINSLERICDSILHPAPHDRRMSITTFKEFLPFDFKSLRENYPTTALNSLNDWQWLTPNAGRFCYTDTTRSSPA